MSAELRALALAMKRNPWFTGVTEQTELRRFAICGISAISSALRQASKDGGRPSAGGVVVSSGVSCRAR
jgi:hypothetical protein